MRTSSLIRPGGLLVVWATAAAPSRSRAGSRSAEAGACAESSGIGSAAVNVSQAGQVLRRDAHRAVLLDAAAPRLEARQPFELVRRHRLRRPGPPRPGRRDRSAAARHRSAHAPGARHSSSPRPPLSPTVTGPPDAPSRSVGRFDSGRPPHRSRHLPRRRSQEFLDSLGFRNSPQSSKLPKPISKTLLRPFFTKDIYRNSHNLQDRRYRRFSKLGTMPA